MENQIHPKVIQFLGLLAQADAVNVDSPILMGGEIAKATGEASNELVRFSWEDQDGAYACKLTEGAIAAGQWNGESFFCEDHEGCNVQVTLYKHVAIVPPKG